MVEREDEEGDVVFLPLPVVSFIRAWLGAAKPSGTGSGGEGEGSKQQI